MIALALLLSAPSWADEQPCPDVSGFLLDAEGEVARFYLSDANKSLAAAVEAWSCAPAAEPASLARYFVTEGTLHLLQENPEAAAISFSAARDVDASFWNADFGEEARAVYEQAARPEGDNGRIAFRNLEKGEVVWVDGRATKPPLKLSPGLHLIQVGDGYQARFARVVNVAPGTEAELALGMLTPVPPVNTGLVALPPPVPQPVVKREKNPRKGRMVAAVVTGSIAAALYGGAIGVRQVYDDSPSDALYFATDGLYFGSVGVGATAGVLGVWALATPKSKR